MKYPRPARKSLVRLTLLIVAASVSAGLWLAGRVGTPRASAQGPFAGFRNFESPQVHPLALTPDGTRLLAVNSPENRLSVFQLTGGVPTLTAEIPVGLEPVSVAARSDREAWVVNWLSDTVSVIDLATGNVTRTSDVGDEPTDVVFAGADNGRALVCVSGTRTVTPFRDGTSFGPASRTFSQPAASQTGADFVVTASAIDASQFFGYLRRDPDTGPDADFAGYNFWLQKLNDFGGDYNAAEMVKAFITSTEYRRRYNQT